MGRAVRENSLAVSSKKVGPWMAPTCPRSPGPFGVKQLHQAHVCRQEVICPPAPSPLSILPLKTLTCMHQSQAGGSCDVVKEDTGSCSSTMVRSTVVWWRRHSLAFWVGQAYKGQPEALQHMGNSDHPPGLFTSSGASSIEHARNTLFA